MSCLSALTELCEDFKSQGIPNLLKSVPDVSGLLEEIQELYDSKGGRRLSAPRGN